MTGPSQFAKRPFDRIMDLILKMSGEYVNPCLESRVQTIQIADTHWQPKSALGLFQRLPDNSPLL